jgi:hypothetical protein
MLRGEGGLAHAPRAGLGGDEFAVLLRDAALARVARWCDAGLDLAVAVNVSAETLLPRAGRWSSPCSTGRRRRRDGPGLHIRAPLPAAELEAWLGDRGRGHRGRLNARLPAACGIILR